MGIRDYAGSESDLAILTNFALRVYDFGGVPSLGPIYNKDSIFGGS